MKPIVFLTGANGSIGRVLVKELLQNGNEFELVLLARRDGRPLPGSWLDLPVEIVEGDITEPNLGLLPSVAIPLQNRVQRVIHAAADVRFKADLPELQRTNLGGTQAVLDFAARCRHLEKFVQVSTTCVSGRRTGAIPEQRLTAGPGFLNGYEQSKWEAEETVFQSGLPFQIVRLSTVIGSEVDGGIDRWGATHLALKFLYQGLMAMVPARPNSRFDFISSELAARAIAASLREVNAQEPVVQVAAGEHAAPLSEFLDLVVEHFGSAHRGWGNGTLRKPPLVDPETFGLFESSVRLSGDLLFNQILDCTQAFLPGLLFPKIVSTSKARALLPDESQWVSWKTVATAVIDHGLARQWNRNLPQYACLD